MHLILGTGLRRAEVTGLDLAQLDPSDPAGLWRVKKAKLNGVHGKGRTSRSVFLGRDARPGLGETGCTIGAVEAGFTSPTTTSVTLNPATVTAGTRVAYLAVVNPQSGTGTPTGTITFTSGTTTLCTAVLSGGVAACGATNAPVGTDTVAGTYSGGDGYATSSGTAILTVTTA